MFLRVILLLLFRIVGVRTSNLQFRIWKGEASQHAQRDRMHNDIAKDGRKVVYRSGFRIPYDKEHLLNVNKIGILTSINSCKSYS